MCRHEIMNGTYCNDKIPGLKLNFTYINKKCANIPHPQKKMKLKMKLIFKKSFWIFF